MLSTNPAVLSGADLKKKKCFTFCYLRSSYMSAGLLVLSLQDKVKNPMFYNAHKMYINVTCCINIKLHMPVKNNNSDFGRLLIFIVCINV